MVQWLRHKVLNLEMEGSTPPGTTLTEEVSYPSIDGGLSRSNSSHYRIRITLNTLFGQYNGVRLVVTVGFEPTD